MILIKRSALTILFLLSIKVAQSEEIGLVSPFENNTETFSTSYSRDDLHFDLLTWAKQNAPALLIPKSIPNADRTIIPFEIVVGIAHNRRVSPRAILAFIIAQYGSFEAYVDQKAYQHVDRDINRLLNLPTEPVSNNYVSTSLSNRYANTFQQNFGPLPYEMNINAFAARAITIDPPADLMQLPYLRGEAWYLFGGPHQDYDPYTDTTPFNAFDLGAKWEDYPANTDNYWLAAAFDGTFYAFSDCIFSVESQDGRWVVDYVHTDNHLKRRGDSVRQNEKLANYAGTRNRALCSGGSSSHPHVHISIWRYNNLTNGYDPVQADGVTMSGYTYRTTQTIAYNYSCAKTYFEKEGVRYCPTVPWSTNPKAILNDLDDLSDDFLLFLLPIFSNSPAN